MLPLSLADSTPQPTDPTGLIIVVVLAVVLIALIIAIMATILICCFCLGVKDYKSGLFDFVV